MMVVCKNCGRKVPGDKKVCIYCGVLLNGTIKCPGCGRELPADVLKCQYCGEQLKSEASIRDGSGTRAAERKARAKGGKGLNSSLLEVMNLMVSGDRSGIIDGLQTLEYWIESDPTSAALWGLKGRGLLELGQVAEAMQCFSKVLSLAPDSAGAWAGSGVCLLRQGNPGKALKYLDKAVELEPKNDFAWFHKGLCLKEQGQLETALECFRMAVKLQPDSYDAWASMAELEYKLGHYQEAVKSLSHFIRSQPNRSDATMDIAKKRLAELKARGVKEHPQTTEEWHEMGDDFLRKDRYKDALMCFKQVLKLQPDDINTWLSVGYAQYQLGNHERALKAYNKALDIDRVNPNALREKSACLRSMGRIEEADALAEQAEMISDYLKGAGFLSIGLHGKALKCLNKALEVDPTYIDALSARGKVLARLERYDEAIEMFDIVLDLAPQAAEILTEKASCLSRLGKFGPALNVCEAVLSEIPDHPTAWFYKAVAEQRLDADEEAIISYKQYIKLEDPNTSENEELLNYAKRMLKELTRSTAVVVDIPPTPAQDLIEQGTKLLQRGKSKEAVNSLSKAVEVDPKAPIAWVNLGVGLEKTGRAEDALKCFDRALALSPNLSGAWLTKGMCLQNLERFEEALSCYEEAVRLNPDESSILNNKGACQNALDMPEDALNSFKGALELDPDNFLAWLNRAWTEDKLSQSKKAIGSFNQFLQLAPPQFEDEITKAQRRLRELRDSMSLPKIKVSAKPLKTIGDKFDVYKSLGRGGFGMVYLAASSGTNDVFALKTFHHEFLKDTRIRAMFRAEAEAWIKLDRHPYLVCAYFVDEVSGRLYIAMEFIPPNDDGINTLETLLMRRPISLKQAVRWAIQFCYGMEYAESKGMRCHRDIKPSNIMIDRHRNIKISDFGLAAVIKPMGDHSSSILTVQGDRVGLSFHSMGNGSCGTPTHMPPEQWANIEACDVRSDIYSFGVTLYQMLNGGKVPFLPELPTVQSPEVIQEFMAELYRMHCEVSPPEIASPLFPMIKRCMAKKRAQRYQSFWELRADLDAMWEEMGEDEVAPPVLATLDADELYNKALSLEFLDRHEESLDLYDEILKLNPDYAPAWIGKGVCWDVLGLHDQAMKYHERALELDSEDPNAWNNKGNCHLDMAQFDAAVECFNRALQLSSNNGTYWRNKGVALANLGRFNEAMLCFDRGLEINPQSAKGWNTKGFFLKEAGRLQEAMGCFQRALELDPMMGVAWRNQGDTLLFMGRFKDAVELYDKAIQLIPHDPDAWGNKGNCLANLGQFDEALVCMERAVKLAPDSAMALNNKGNLLNQLKRYEAAAECFDRALEVEPDMVLAIRNKGLSYRGQGALDKAITCFEQALKIVPEDTSAWYYKGQSLEQLARFDKAITCFEKVIALERSNQRAVAMAYFNRGRCFQKLKRFQEAISSYEKALEIDPNYAAADEQMDLCLRGLG